MAENMSEVNYLEIQGDHCICQDMIPLAIVWGHWSTLMEAERTLNNLYFLHFLSVTMTIIDRQRRFVRVRLVGHEYVCS